MFLNAGNGALLPQQRYGIGNTPGLGTVADFNADGRPDVAAAIGLPPSGLGNAIVLLRSAASAPVSLAVDAAGNGVLEPGETVVMAPTWRNTSAAAMAVTGVASSFTGPAGPTYAIADATADYGTIDAGDTASCGTDCYSLNIAAASRPATHWDSHRPGDGDAHRPAKTWTAPRRRELHRHAAVEPTIRSSRRMFHQGVTAGCTANAYCPETPRPASRWPSFFSRQRVPTTSLPRRAAPVFTDVPVSHPFASWVEELADRASSEVAAEATTARPPRRPASRWPSFS